MPASSSTKRKAGPPNSLSVSQLRQRLRRKPRERVQVLERELRDFTSFIRRGYGWCWSSTRQPSKDQGYPQVPCGAPGAAGYSLRPYMAHQLSWMHANGREPPNPRVTGTNLSHLCGNPQCYRLDHLYEEDSGYNNRRKGCQVYIECVEGNACQYRGIIYICNHQPRCIRYHPAFEQPGEMEQMFPLGHSHNRAPPLEVRDNKRDDSNIVLRPGSKSLRDLRQHAIGLVNSMPGSSVSRRPHSIDGDHSETDDESQSTTSRKHLRVEATCASEGKKVIVLSESDESDDDSKQSSSSPIRTASIYFK